jgi:trafficking protein particle complex subunit 9
LSPQIPAILQPQVSFASPQVEPGKSQSRPDLSLSNDITTDPFASQSLLDVLPDTHHHILHLHQRSLGSSSVDPLPLVCFPDHIIRLATLLCDVFAKGVLDHVVLKANVLGVPIVHKSSNANMYPPRGEIARWAMRAWGSHLEHESVPISHHIRVVSALVNIMGIIGFHRKRSALLSALLHLFIPQLVQARVIGASEWGLHPNAAQSYVGHNTADDGLVQLMSSLAKVYGVQAARDDRGTFGWPSLRTHILKECIAFCEALPHPAGVAHFTSLLFSVAPDGLEKDEQIRLASSLPRIVANSRRRGDLIEADYWDEFVVQDIQIIE